ncbi:WD40 repeat-like protein [Pholiota conissans]|uniref:Probable cytosolic iron-sulfur protein assembly protein 1 n=1 Tax=Pholiota conissans TaxID=109636 RepID=A0A9P5YY50_9AGAR|nr:WD40 repeat-like protein [Pholiota conissans]
MNIDLPYTIQPISELPGHEDRAWHVAWNPTKPLLASCSADKTVRIYAYSSTSNEESKSIPTYAFKTLTSIPTGHAKTVRAVAWAPSGETLATASFDSNIGIWECEKVDDMENGENDGSGEWECISTLEGHETECKSVAYSSTGTLLASCSRDKTVWIWEVHPDGEFETISVLMEHSQDVKCVAWHPSEEILASASYDDTIKLYIEDPSDDWFCFSTLSGHTSTVWSLAWSPVFDSSEECTSSTHGSGGPHSHSHATTASYLASASDDTTIRIWKRIAEHKWECVLVLGGHERSVYSVSWCRGVRPAFTEEGTYLGWLASASGDGKVLVWELWDPPSSSAISTPPRHKLIASLSSAHGVHDVNSVVWNPRSGFEDLLATTGDDGCTRVWRITPSS